MPNVPSARLAARIALKAILAAKMAAIFPDDMPAGWPEAPSVREVDQEPSASQAGGEVVLERGSLTPTPVEFGNGNGAVYEHRMTVPIAVYVEHDDADLAAAAFDALQKAIGEAVQADVTLGGVVDVCEFTESENDQLGGEGNPNGEGALISLDLVWHSAKPFG